MNFTIKKGRHRASPLRFGISTKSPHYVKTIIFYPSCIYNLEGDTKSMSGDDWDCNKLFGFGVFNLRVFPPHHYESLRVGWEYNSEKGRIDLFAYCYQKGQRQISFITDAAIGKPVNVIMFASNLFYFIYINSDKGTFDFKLERGINSSIYYDLDPYFGGNQVAPHDIELSIS